MPLTLIKETGSGLPDANSYASVADADSFHDGHLYATTWTSATTANKEKALVLATRLIDASYQFNGSKTKVTQALQWPREGAIDPDRKTLQFSALSNVFGPFFESDQVPKALLDATCEMAREVLFADRTDSPDGEGILQLSLVGALTVIFDKKDRRPVISHLAQSILSKLGTLIRPTQRAATLVRV
ncbi:MAG: hypothetical protein L0Y58_01410 [Verrucomicrobia subdivision 3 bacterium]|nr:hypothetical protein [Limisphaerales bacterium]